MNVPPKIHQDCENSGNTTEISNTDHSCAISTSKPYLKQAAQRLASKYLFPILETCEQKNFSFILELTEQGLILQTTKIKDLGTLQVDFLKGKIGYRLGNIQNQKQLLSKAIGTKLNLKANILDLTAGLGTDGFTLAQLGFSVTLLERSPIVAALLNDGLHRALKNQKYSHVNIQLIHTNAAYYLKQMIYLQKFHSKQSANNLGAPDQVDNSDNNLSKTKLEHEKKSPDIIYLDPMYPHSNKSALVKKEMRLLREIVGDDLDAESLLPLALRCAKQRVVVKRPRLAAFLAQLKPHHSILGKQHRFDIYLANNNR